MAQVAIDILLNLVIMNTNDMTHRIDPGVAMARRKGNGTSQDSQATCSSHPNVLGDRVIAYEGRFP